MNIYLKQLCRGFLNCKKVLLIAFLPAVLYLILASFWTNTTDPEQAVRFAWHPELLMPTLLIFGVSLLLVIAFVLAFEWADPSFKSERQMARYMDVPVLGSLPNLDPLSSKLKPPPRG